MPSASAPPAHPTVIALNDEFNRLVRRKINTRYGSRGEMGKVHPVDPFVVSDGEILVRSECWEDLIGALRAV